MNSIMVFSCMILLSMFFIDTNNVERITDELKPSVLELKSKDYRFEDYQDLDSLYSKIGEAKVVLLGESRHGDSTSTCEMKLRIIDYLIKKQGFEVYLNEIPIIDGFFMKQIMSQGRSMGQAGCLSQKYWMGSDFSQYRGNIKCLYQYFDDTRLVSDNQVMYSGFDWFVNLKFVDYYEELLIKSGAGLQNSKAWMEYKEGYRNACNNIESDNKSTLQTILNSGYALIGIIQNTDVINQNTKLWLSQLLICSQQSICALPELRKRKMDPWLSAQREILMYQNVKWLLTRIYSGKKVILSASNYHILKNFGLLEPSYKSTCGRSTLATYINDSLDIQTYSIAFIEYSGYTGNYKQSFKVPDKSRNSLEYKLHELQYKFAFIDLKGIKSMHPEGWLSKEFVMTSTMALNKANIKSRWSELYGGLVFIDKMEPVGIYRYDGGCN